MGKNRKSPRKSITLAPEMWEWLETKAAEEEWNLSLTLRKLLRKTMASCNRAEACGSEYGLPFGHYDAEARFLDRDVGFAKAESLGLVHEDGALFDAVALWGERILQAVRDLSPDVLAAMLALRDQMTAARS